jgi:hypothetical protein
MYYTYNTSKYTMEFIMNESTVGVNNELDLCFPKNIVGIIAKYHYTEYNGMCHQIVRHTKLRYTIIGMRTIAQSIGIDLRVSIGNNIAIANGTYYNSNMHIPQADDNSSAFVSYKSGIDAKHHRMLVESYENATLNAPPLLVRQSGYFYRGQFPKLGICKNVERILDMIKCGYLDTIRDFISLHYDNETMDVKVTDGVRNFDSVDNIDNHVAALDAYADGDIVFLRYIISYYYKMASIKIHIYINSNITVRTHTGELLYYN